MKSQKLVLFKYSWDFKKKKKLFEQQFPRSFCVYTGTLQECPLARDGTNLYITIKNLLFALKLIYLSPSSLKKFTSWPIKSLKWKIYKIIHCISRKTFSQNIWTIYKFGQQKKSTKQFTYLDDKKNNYNKLITNSNKTNHKNPITFHNTLIDS